MKPKLDLEGAYQASLGEIKRPLRGQSSCNSGKGGSSDQKWIHKSNVNQMNPSSRVLRMDESSGQYSDTAAGFQFRSVGSMNHGPSKRQKTISKPPVYYGTTNGGTVPKTNKEPAAKVADERRLGDGGHRPSSKSRKDILSKLFSGNLVETFTVDDETYARAQVRATFYPKFENEKTHHEVRRLRTRMIELVSKGLATMEVSLKHSGSLFMYAGKEGGSYAKNSFSNVYTAVGVFVLGRTFHEAWGTEAVKKQLEFSAYLEKNRMCISMELVTAVLGDHGQRPQEDYVVVTAVTDLGCGKPKFYSTPEIIAFCRTWRLPTNHVWLFSTRKSVSSFFAAYDALYEEGTATPVCKVLNEVADISVPGSKDHVKAQGEILEGLVARIVSSESSKHMEQVLKDFPLPASKEATANLGPSLREICAANRSDEKQRIKALLQNIGGSFCPNFVDWFGIDSDSLTRNDVRAFLSKFLQACPSDFSTTKLQEMVRWMMDKRYDKDNEVDFKCYHNSHKIDMVSSDNLHFKMVIHVRSDSVFQRYQGEMRRNPRLWPLYRGFFVDLDLFKANKEQNDKFAKDVKNINASGLDDTVRKDGLADEDANLMIKLKFLTYKLRTFLIRNGLSILFKDGPSAYEKYYMKQMKNWNTSPGKQRELSKMLDEWARYIRMKCNYKELSPSIYLSEAEPFLEQYAKRSPQNQVLVGAAGNLICAEDFLAIIDHGRDEELQQERDIESISPSKSVRDSVSKDEGMIVFFPGIPGCAKSALCKEILNVQGGLDDRPVHTLMGDLIKGRYWPKIAAERRRKPRSILLADKNAPNEEVWKQIEDMCRTTKALAVPVVPDSEGTERNPFSLDALAVFVFRVLQRSNHPGNLDKSSQYAGYVLLMFYDLYDRKSRKEFESELIERFGSLVKIPLLNPDRSPLPDPVKSVLEEGINLFMRLKQLLRRLESTKGAFPKEWTIWEVKLRKIMIENAKYLSSIQVPFEVAVEQVLKQLKAVAQGEYARPLTEKRELRNVVFAAVTLPVAEIHQLLHDLANKDPAVEAFLKDKKMKSSLTEAHVTLAHKGRHGIAAVANYASFLHKEVPVEITALLFSDTLAALEANPGSVEGEKVTSNNEWPHATIWTAKGTPAKEATALAKLHSEEKATRIEFNPPITLTGILELFY